MYRYYDYEIKYGRRNLSYHTPAGKLTDLQQFLESAYHQHHDSTLDVRYEDDSWSIQTTPRVDDWFPGMSSCLNS